MPLESTQSESEEAIAKSWKSSASPRSVLAVVSFWLLLVLAVAFLGLIGVLIYWGGRIESTLLVEGKPVFVVLDAGRPRIWLLLSLPAALLAGALSVRKVRKPE